MRMYSAEEVQEAIEQAVAPLRAAAVVAQQLELAMSKVVLAGDDRAVIAYLAGWTLHDPKLGAIGVLGVSPHTIANETGIPYRTVVRVLFGAKRVAKGELVIKGLVQRGVVICHSRGSGRREAVFSLNLKFEEWATSWRPKSKREVLLDLQNVRFAAQMRAAQPEFFAAPTRGTTGSVEPSWVPLRRRKGKVFAAPERGETDDVAPRNARGTTASDGAASTISLVLTEPSSSQKEENRAPQPIEMTPAASKVLDTIREVTGRTLFDPDGRPGPRFEVLQALCDIEDAGFICAELRRTRPRWKEAVQLVKDLARQGPARTASGERCDQCGGRSWVLDDNGEAVPCPACRAEEQMA